jgi:catechol 2,3-dioxygenase-like lactoylglutathione lyase family enzyme
MRRLVLLFVFLWTVSSADDAPVTTAVWQEAVVSVTDLDRSARFFKEIGGYEDKWRGPMDASEIRSWGLDNSASAEALLLGPPGQETGLVRLVRFDNAGRKEPTRPGARAWDTGCYFSLMVRMKDMRSVYDDAVAMGWWTETPITYLEFGESQLNVMVFRGPDGVQVQAYERLAPPLPEAIPPFERFTRPFNIMQMVRDRDAAYSFFTDVLGFDTFYNGKPYVSEEPEYMPLGIPKNLTTSIRYRAGIVYPTPGEFGRMEMIEIMDLDGHDFAERCKAPNLGILAVRFPVESLRRAEFRIHRHGWPLASPLSRALIEPYGTVRTLSVKTPDGANVQFVEHVDPEEKGRRNRVFYVDPDTDG